jgi:hypothetical protein
MKNGMENFNLLKGLIIFSCLLTLSACSKEIILDEVKVGEEFSLKLGDSINLTDKETVLSELQIYDISDSRCPVNAQCIRAGEAVVTIGLKEISQKFLITELCIGECTQIGSSPPQTPQITIKVDNVYFTLTLKEVNPYPSLNDSGVVKTATIIFDSYAIEN